MTYFPAYSYSSSTGWMFDIQAGSSSQATSKPSHPDSLSPFMTEYQNILSGAHQHDIPISKYSALAGALGPADPSPSPVSRPAPRLALQQVQLQLVQPVVSQPAGPALPHLVQQVFNQPAQSIHPQSVAPTHSGVQNQNVAPQPATTTRRRAYVLANPPARRRREPAGTPRFCRVDGCKQWTAEGGKKLDRHRASHFPGQVGIACHKCGRVFSRSSACRDHLERCDPLLWNQIAAAKGTQDAWGIRVGKDLIERNLVDGEYTPRRKYKLP